jgi:repressor LexA
MMACVSAAPTKRQHEIAAFIASEFHSRGMMPTQREIAARFGFASPNAVRTHLRLMEKKGMLARMPHKARGLKLRAVPGTGIPLLGKIAAGVPQGALESPDDMLPVPPQLFRGTDLFALRVKGDSMKDAGILPGDIAVLNRQQDIADGEIAAVLLDDDATLKFLHRRRGSVVLRGANPAFSDIVIRGSDVRAVRILGKYVGLIRQRGAT